MTGKNEMPSVIVGFDGTDAARVAVLMAAEEAALRGLRLRILHAVEAAVGALGAAQPVMVDAQLAHAVADAAIAAVAAEAAALAQQRLPADRIDVETVRGSAQDELFARSVGAQLLVLGRGHPNALGVLLGSVALDAATGASCPVLVVPEPGPEGPRTAGVVVVGVHGVDDSADALEEAFTEAALRHAQLVAVHTWTYVGSAGRGDLGSGSLAALDPLGLDRDEAVLREALEPFRARFPHIGVTEQVSEGRPAHTLVELSAEAALLVVGTRGRGPVKGLLLGSVGQDVVRHARCPVLVARPRVGKTADNLA